MSIGVIFASHGRDVECCREALRRVGCDDIRVITTNLDDISADSALSHAVVEIFDPQYAQNGSAHCVSDESEGIRVLKQLRDRFPQCAIFAISHTSCMNGSEYVETALLADRCLAIDWAALDPVSLITLGLERALEAHPVLLPLWQKGPVSNAQPAA